MALAGKSVNSIAEFRAESRGRFTDLLKCIGSMKNILKPRSVLKSNKIIP